MSLLFDQNVSRRLVGLLAGEYPGSEHVEGAGLSGADDSIVWNYAAAKGLMIVSKDSDFRHLALLHGPPPTGDLAAGRQWADGDSRGPPACASGGCAGVRCGPSPGIVGAPLAPR